MRGWDTHAFACTDPPDSLSGADQTENSGAVECTDAHRDVQRSAQLCSETQTDSSGYCELIMAFVEDSDRAALSSLIKFRLPSITILLHVRSTFFSFISSMQFKMLAF